MTNWREIDRIRKDARGFRALAAHLLKHHSGELNEWELDFLETNVRRLHFEEFSTLQGETLVGIRDSVILVETFDGFSAAALIRQCHEARRDLSEHDEDWIIALRKRSSVTIRRREVGRLARICRQLNILDPVDA